MVGTNSFGISDEAMVQIGGYLSQNRDEVLRIPMVRAMLATARYRAFAASEAVKTIDSDNATQSALGHNLTGLAHGAGFERVIQIVAPLLGMSGLFRRLNKMQTLVIGPRSEVEIMALVGFGFPISHMTVIDIISYSPFVKLMDVCDMSFADNTFDLVIMGWVLPYLKDARIAAAEIARVLRPGGVVTIGVDYSRGQVSKETEDHVPLEYGSAEDVLALFGDNAGRVLFSSNASDHVADWEKHIVATFEIRK